MRDTRIVMIGTRIHTRVLHNQPCYIHTLHRYAHMRQCMSTISPFCALAIRRRQVISTCPWDECQHFINAQCIDGNKYVLHSDILFNLLHFVCGLVWHTLTHNTIMRKMYVFLSGVCPTFVIYRSETVAKILIRRDHSACTHFQSAHRFWRCVRVALDWIWVAITTFQRFRL